MSNLMERVVGELFKSGAAANVMRHRKISFSYCEILGSDANDCLSPAHDAVKIGEMLDGRVVLKNLSEHEVRMRRPCSYLHAIDASARRRLLDGVPVTRCPLAGPPRHRRDVRLTHC